MLLVNWQGKHKQYPSIWIGEKKIPGFRGTIAVHKNKPIGNSIWEST